MSTHPDRAFAGALRNAAPTETAAYVGFATEVMSHDGAIPLKMRELIAVAVALTTQCQLCLQSHTTAARKAGASEAELGEVVFITSALRAGAAYTHGLAAMRYYEEAGSGANGKA